MLSKKNPDDQSHLNLVDHDNEEQHSKNGMFPPSNSSTSKFFQSHSLKFGTTEETDETRNQKTDRKTLHEANARFQEAQVRELPDVKDILADLHFEEKEQEGNKGGQLCIGKNKVGSKESQEVEERKKSEGTAKVESQSESTDSIEKYWKILGEEVAQKKIRYQDITIQRYKFTDKDREGYFKDMIDLLYDEDYKPIQKKPDCLFDLDINQHTGHTFIRTVITDKYHKNSTDFMSVKSMEVFVQTINDNGAPTQFESIGKILLDVFVGDCENDFFRHLNDFKKKGSNTYYFQREEDQQGYKFQLMCHKVNVPRVKFVRDDELDNVKANVIREKPSQSIYELEDYCLKIPQNWAISSKDWINIKKQSSEVFPHIKDSLKKKEGIERDIELQFMINATQNMKSDQKLKQNSHVYLDQSYVMIKRTVEIDTSKGNRYQTDLLIYKLSNLVKPVVQIDSLHFGSIFNGFYEVLPDSNVNFYLLGYDEAYKLMANDNHTLRNEDLEAKSKYYETEQFTSSAFTQNQIQVKYFDVCFTSFDENNNKKEAHVWQSFFFNEEFEPMLINPLYDTKSSVGRQKKEETIKQILEGILKYKREQIENGIHKKDKGQIVFNQQGSLLMKNNNEDQQVSIKYNDKYFKVHALDRFLACSKGIGFDKQEKDYDQIFEFKHHLQQEHDGEQDKHHIQYLTSPHLFVRVSLKNNIMHIFQIKDYHCAPTFVEKMEQLRLEVSKKNFKQKYLFTKMLEQFEAISEKSPSKQYQDNYKVQQFQTLQNQRIQPFYISHDKKNVFYQHNSVHINGEHFEFASDEMMVLEMPDTGTLEQLRLFDSNYSNDIKLIKYQVSRQAQAIIFIFLQRNTDRYDKLEKDEVKANSKRELQSGGNTGVHFMTILSLADVRQKITEHEPVLVQQQTPIYLLSKFKEMSKFFMYDRKDLKKHQDNNRDGICSDTSLYFDIITDDGGPDENYLKFIFFQHEFFVHPINFDKHYKRSKSISQEVQRVNIHGHQQFQPYFCIINIKQFLDDHEARYQMNKFSKKLSRKMSVIMKGEPEEVVEQNDISRDWLFTQKIQLYLSPFVQDCLKRDHYMNHCVSLFNTHCPLFTRVSDWQYRLTEVSSINQISARFNVGFPYRNHGLILYEIKEFLVTLDTTSFSPRDPKIDIISMKYAIQSTSFQKQNNVKIKTKNEEVTRKINHQNDMLVPRIDDNGHIEGTVLMINTIIAEKKPFILTKEMVEKIQAQDKAKQFESTKQKQWLSSKIGKLALIYGVRDWYNTYHVKFQDNRKIVLHEQKENPFFKESQDQKYSIDPHYYYEMVDLDLCNQLDKSQSNAANKLMNKLYKVGCYKIAFQQQPFNNIMLTHCSLTKQAIKEQIFYGNDAVIELYHMLKMNISMSLPNFKELFYFDSRQRNISYFQPRFILNGHSYCWHEKYEFQIDINRLEAAFKLVYNKHEVYEKVNHLQNSAFYEANLALSFNKRQHSVQKLLGLSESLNMNRFFRFQTDFMVAESIISMGLDLDIIRPVRMIFEEIFEKRKNMELQQVLVQELPQLLHQKRVDVLKFLDLSYDEIQREFIELNEDECFNEQNEQFNQNYIFCNLETFLKSNFLPSLTKFPIHPDFNGLFRHKKLKIENQFDSQREAENQLMKSSESYIESVDHYFRFRKYATDILGFFWSGVQFNKKKYQTVAQVHHSMINFLPMIRKLKIDIFMNREATVKNSTEYLKVFQSRWSCLRIKPRNIKNNELLIATIIAAKSSSDTPESLEFYNMSTVKKIIDLQQPFAMNLNSLNKYIYIFFYCMPFFVHIIYNQLYYQNGYLDGNEDNKQVTYQVMTIMGVIQLIITTCECIEIFYDGFVNYIANIYNIMQVLQLIAYIYQCGSNYLLLENLLCEGCLAKREPGSIPLETLLLWQKFSEFILLTCIFIKIFEFLNAEKQTRLITQMFIEVMYDIRPFLIVFLWLVLILTCFWVVFDVRACEDDLSGFKCTGQDDDYPEINRFLQLFLMTFRQSVGDLQPPKYEYWSDLKDTNPQTSNSAIMLIWFAWFINVILTLIVMLNFLIAEVGATYNRVVGLGQKNHYRQMSSVNKKYYLLCYFCRNHRKFRYDAIVLTTRMDRYDNGDGAANDSTQWTNSQQEMQKAISMVDKRIGGNKKQIEIIDKKTTALDQKLSKFLKQIGMPQEEEKNPDEM